MTETHFAAAPVDQPDTARVPVTVWLSPEQAARFEILAARAARLNPGSDDNVLVDTLFGIGIDLAEIVADALERGRSN